MRSKEEEYHTLQQESQQSEMELNKLRDQKVPYSAIRGVFPFLV